MPTGKPQPEAFMLSQSQASSRLLNILPMIAFLLTILISMLTVPTPVLWMVDVFARGGNGAHLEEALPRVAQSTDVRGFGHFERLSSSKWASVSHILPGRYFDPRNTKGINLNLIRCPKFFIAIIWLFLWPFQFTTSLRWKSPRVHRWVGTFLLVDAATILLGIIPMCTTGAC
jgi:hypothetical protein